MKKFILFTFIFVSVLASGCSMNTKNNTTNSDKVIQQSSMNTDKLMNTGFKEVEKSFGTPYSSVYYIDTNKLSGKDMNTLAMEDLRDSVTILSSYKNKEKNDEYIHVYYENGKAKDALSGAYNLSTSDRFTSKDLSKADYKVEFFNGKGLICSDDFKLEYVKKDFVNKKISDFNNAYDLKSANFIASTMTSNDKIYFYPLVAHKVHPRAEHKHPNYSSNHDAKLDTVNPVNNNISTVNSTTNKDLGDYSKSAVLVHTKDDKIQTIEIVDNNFVLGLMNKSLQR